MVGIVALKRALAAETTGVGEDKGPDLGAKNLWETEQM